MGPLRIAVSACLVGHTVRYDGASKEQLPLLATLGSDIELIPLCPEVGAGMPVPRPPIRVEEHEGGRRVIRMVDGADMTGALDRFAASALKAAASYDGCVLKARSPSCGSLDTPIFRPSALEPHAVGAGHWAQALLLHNPHLPIIDEERLGEPKLRAAFLERARRRAEERHRAV